MKLLVLIATLLSFSSLAQVNYTYDKSGNRVASRYEVYKYDSMQNHKTETTAESTRLLNDNLFSVFPNPTNSGISINTPDDKLLLDIALYDLSGKEFISLKRTAVKWVDLSALSEGVYFVRITTENKPPQVWKVIKH